MENREQLVVVTKRVNSAGYNTVCLMKGSIGKRVAKNPSFIGGKELATIEFEESTWALSENQFRELKELEREMINATEKFKEIG